jgi:oxygen-independent coproporphyrinogen-3 oxidase
MSPELELFGCDDRLDGEPVAGSYFVSAYPPFRYWAGEGVRHVHGLLESPQVTLPEPPTGVYVHVPFCAKKCDYCYYRSMTGSTDRERDTYVDALLAEAEMYRAASCVNGRQISFAYIGGGTPSLLSKLQIRKLLAGLQQSFVWDAVEEVTFECAPQSITLDKLRELRSLGVTRLSMGVQHLDNEVLRLNGRTHLAEDVERAYGLMRSGCPDAIVNLDLIVGLLGDRDDSFERSLEQCLSWAPESLTIYQLEVPRNTALFRSLQDTRTAASIPTWQVKRLRLARAFEKLEQNGYTIRSAYTAVRSPEFRSFVYQDAQYHGADLFGIGLSSFSYVGGTHYQNTSRMHSYLDHIAQQSPPVDRAYWLSCEEQMVREVVLQLKLGALSREYFSTKFGVDILWRFSRQWKAWAHRDWLQIRPNGVQLTRQGLLRVDRLVIGLYETMHRHESPIATPD